MGKLCTFFGHRRCYFSDKDYERIREVLTDLIENFAHKKKKIIINLAESRPDFVPFEISKK